MTFTNMNNIDKFFETVDKCEGKVELVTEQGDRFNLKSTLTKYVIFVKIVSNCIVPSVKINTYNYVHLSGNSHRMWQQHIPNVLNRLEELRKRNEWTLELDSIFNCIEYDSSKCGIQKIKIYNKKIN